MVKEHKVYVLDPLIPSEIKQLEKLLDSGWRPLDSAPVQPGVVVYILDRVESK